MATKRTQRSRTKVTTTIEPAVEPVVSVIVLHYNTLDLTLDCVRSILEQREAPAYEIIVVDNASTDKSGGQLAVKLRNKARLIRTKRNLGFGPGNNYGASFAKGRYLFFVNSDTLFSPTLLGDMLQTADKHPEYGLLSPRVILPGRQKETQPASFGRFATVRRLLTRRVDLSTKYLDGVDEIARCDWVTGAAMWLPAEVFHKVGGFDSRYFMYWEDQDLCRAVTRAGWRVGVIPDAVITHLGGRSVKLSKDRYKLYDQSQRTFIQKHQGLIALTVFVALSWPWKVWRNRRAKK